MTFHDVLSKGEAEEEGDGRAGVSPPKVAKQIGGVAKQYCKVVDMAKRRDYCLFLIVIHVSLHKHVVYELEYYWNDMKFFLISA